jgi:hypothetical protein
MYDFLEHEILCTILDKIIKQLIDGIRKRKYEKQQIIERDPFQVNTREFL